MRLFRFGENLNGLLNFIFAGFARRRPAFRRGGIRKSLEKFFRKVNLCLNKTQEEAMVQADMMLKGLALIGVYYLLRWAAIVVLRLDGYDVKSHRQRWLNVATVVLALGIGWTYLRFEADPPNRQDHPRVAERSTNIVREPDSAAPRTSILLSENPVVLDVVPDFSFGFDPELDRGEFDAAGDSNGRLKRVFQPYVALSTYTDFTRVQPTDEAQHVAERIREIDAANEAFASALPQLLSVTDETSPPSVSIATDQALSLSDWAGDPDLMVLNAKDVTISFDPEPSFEFIEEFKRFESDDIFDWASSEDGTLEARQYSIHRDLSSWATTISAVQREEREQRFDPGVSDIPGAPRRQVEELMRAAPAFYEKIPEVRRFLGR